MLSRFLWLFYLILLYFTSYHHVLKDYWLDRKRNRHVDHLIHTLVKDMLSTYEDHHKRQKLGMQGPNLAEKRQKDILTCAPETPLDRIKEIDESHFQVQSSSSEKIYDISFYICTCLDYPCIQLCKHIAVIVHFFGGKLERAELGPHAPVNVSKPSKPSKAEPIVPKFLTHSAGRSKACLIAAVNDISTQCHASQPNWQQGSTSRKRTGHPQSIILAPNSHVYGGETQWKALRKS